MMSACSYSFRLNCLLKLLQLRPTVSLYLSTKCVYLLFIGSGVCTNSRSCDLERMKRDVTRYFIFPRKSIPLKALQYDAVRRVFKHKSHFWQVKYDSTIPMKYRFVSEWSAWFGALVNSWLSVTQLPMELWSRLITTPIHSNDQFGNVLSEDSIICVPFGRVAVFWWTFQSPEESNRIGKYVMALTLTHSVNCTANLIVD